MDNQDNITISKYINGELSGAELAEFEKLLQQDKALADEVNFHKIVDESLLENYQATSKIDKSEQLEFEGILREIMEGKEIINPPIKAPPSIIRRLIPIAVIAVAASLVFFFWPNSKNTNSNLADVYYIPYEFSVSTMDNEYNILNEAEKAYKTKEYEKALSIFKNHPGNLRVQIAKGNTEYNLKKYSEAVKTFKKVIQNSNNVSFKNYAKWYLALTYLKKDDKDQAIKLLGQLPESADFYKQAQNLIKELE